MDIRKPRQIKKSPWGHFTESDIWFSNDDCPLWVFANTATILVPYISHVIQQQIHRHNQVALLKARGKPVSWPYLFLILISTVTFTQAICEAADKPAHTHICSAEIPQIHVSIHIHYDSPIQTHSRRQTPLSSLSHQEMDTYPLLTRPTGSTCCCISGPL